MQENPPEGFYAWVLDIIANPPRGGVGDKIFVVNGCEFDNIFIYFNKHLTINILSKDPIRLI